MRGTQYRLAPSLIPPTKDMEQEIFDLNNSHFVLGYISFMHNGPRLLFFFSLGLLLNFSASFL